MIIFLMGQKAISVYFQSPVQSVLSLYSQTKCMAYLKKQRILPNMTLCGTPLPWVEKLKPLGITRNFYCCQKDILIKRPRYIKRNFEILQEFHFATQEMKMKLQSIYNSHFPGSSCWDITSPAGRIMEGSINKNIKITYDLPCAVHSNISSN